MIQNNKKFSIKVKTAILSQERKLINKISLNTWLTVEDKCDTEVKILEES